MAAPTETLEFWPDRPQALVERMGEMAVTGDGWINLTPHVGDEDPELPGDGLFGAFSARGPAVPLCTWVPARRRRERRGRQSLGVQHATGTRAAARLAGAGHPVPEGWRVTQDHPRRGLVVEVHADEPPERVLSWLIGAGEALCLPTPTGQWRAALYRG
ncbi:MAG TPA: hypothetical protein VFA11_17030 [Acidimicrobiales bacterium]|nr:hypothetical protein [Acidimicrobiales bacterium]